MPSLFFFLSRQSYFGAATEGGREARATPCLPARSLGGASWLLTGGEGRGVPRGQAGGVGCPHPFGGAVCGAGGGGGMHGTLLLLLALQSGNWVFFFLVSLYLLSRICPN